MEDKLLTFIKDMNEILYEKDPIFEEMPLEYSTDGDTDLIGFNGTRLWISNEHSDWKELLEETYRLAEAYTKLRNFMGEFFRSKLNKDIEEKYGLGIETPNTPLSERDRPEI